MKSETLNIARSSAPYTTRNVLLLIRDNGFHFIICSLSNEGGYTERSRLEFC